MSARASVKTQVDQIRRDVLADGESFVGCEELQGLCPGEATFTDQLDRITGLAQQEGWGFAFLTDGSVRFTGKRRRVAVNAAR